MKTSELTGPALDWAVAKCEGLEVDGDGPIWFGDHPHYNEAARVTYAPSTDWGQGGPIIEREGINVTNPGGYWHASYARFDPDTNYDWFEHPNHADTPLIAAMRCFVASRLGDEVEIPKELV